MTSFCDATSKKLRRFLWFQAQETEEESVPYDSQQLLEGQEQGQGEEVIQTEVTEVKPGDSVLKPR